MNTVNVMKQAVLSGQNLNKEEAMQLYEMPLAEICQAADEIRAHFCGCIFDLCTIVNGKSGRCSENCKFCAQSSFHTSETESYPLLKTEPLLNHAKECERQGVLRYSIVTSGRYLNDRELEQLCKSIRVLCAKTELQICVSAGLLTETQFVRLKEAGVTRIHNNLETAESYFPKVCTTHSFADKVEAVRAAQRAGLTVCSGGLMGIGETVEERIDLALALRQLGIRSIPVNMLNPIPGTPLEHREPLCAEDMRRIVAVYRFLLPEAQIRLAGGRGLMEDKGLSCFASGANAAITGDMLTTSGISTETDRKMVEALGYRITLSE